jgi:energy-coupling factor transporter ATP-binding protein EcfA2
VVIATHDVELVAEVCTRMVMLADGEVVLDTDARSAAMSSPAFAPQIAKIVAPAPYLTVAEVERLLPVGIAL